MTTTKKKKTKKVKLEYCAVSSTLVHDGKSYVCGDDVSDLPADVIKALGDKVRIKK